MTKSFYIFLFFLGLVSNVNASVVYNYTGNTLLHSNDLGMTEEAPPLNISIAFSDTGSTLLSWRISSSSANEITNTTPNVTWSINLKTDASGFVTSWDVSIGRYDTYDYGGMNREISEGFDSTLSFDRYFWTVLYDPTGGFILETNFDQPGIWSSTAAIANLNYNSEVPTPTANILMLSGLCIIITILKRNILSRSTTMADYA